MVSNEAVGFVAKESWKKGFEGAVIFFFCGLTLVSISKVVTGHEIDEREKIH